MPCTTRCATAWFRWRGDVPSECPDARPSRYRDARVAKARLADAVVDSASGRPNCTAPCMPNTREVRSLVFGAPRHAQRILVAGARAY